MMRKVILAPMLALTTLLLASPLLFTMINADGESDNYVICEALADRLSVVNSAGGRAIIYQFPSNSVPVYVEIDSSGNYIVCESSNILSKITPTGERTVIYTFSANTGPNDVIISTVPQLLAYVTENGLRATWTQSTDPFFSGYQLYQSSTHGDLGTLIGTNTNVADTSLAVTGLSPWTTYYFTVRVLGANGAYVDYGQWSVTTAKAFWQQVWFVQVIFVAIVVGIVVIAIYALYSSSKKKITSVT